MAAPHTAGVAALIVSEFGKQDHGRSGLTLDPDKTADIREHSATDHACPNPREFVYPDLPADYTATCEGGKGCNGFYGHGIVDALSAVKYDG